MELQEQDQDAFKVCLHCPRRKQKALSSTNFSRHLKKKHNPVYNTLEGKKYKRTRFNVDFVYADEEQIQSKKRQKKEDEEVK